MQTKIFRMQEHSSLTIPLNELGYIKHSERALGGRANPKDVEKRALDRFIRKNREVLSFLDIEIKGMKLISKGKAGVVPLYPAIPDDVEGTFMVYPMIPWYILSEFVGKAREGDWLEVRQEWEVDSIYLELELWYFARPFVTEAKLALEKPGRAFQTNTQINQYPHGLTDWNEYSVSRYPFYDLQFKNRTIKPSIHTISHSIIKWFVEKIGSSISKKELVSEDFLDDLNWMNNFLKDIKPIPSNKELFKLLPRTGAWTGYKKVYDELERLAAISGILDNQSSKGCAFSIKAEDLFELMIVNFCREWAYLNGFTITQDDDDSARIGLSEYYNSEAEILRSLRPDIVLTSRNVVIIIDAKYKRHYDLLNKKKADKSSFWYEEFRHDLHQVLSYGITQNKGKKVFLLSHPTLLTTLKYETLQLWKVGGKKDILIGLLPVCFNKKVLSLKTIKKAYFNGLTKLLDLGLLDGSGIESQDLN